MLQDLSATDIERYIKSKFTANAGFAEFQVRDPSSARELLVSMKAEGVFLWMHLVVQSLLEGLTNGDGSGISIVGSKSCRQISKISTQRSWRTCTTNI